MFEKEEEKLKELRSYLEHTDIPQAKVDVVILQGMERAKREKQVRRTKRKNAYWTLAVSAVLLITLVTSIRVSPAFANAVSSIPGMEKIVSMIQFDKGLTAAIENDYYQVIDVSQTRENLKLTIDGVILDESGMNIFYTVRSEEKLQNTEVRNVEIKNRNISRPSSSSYGVSPDDNAVNEFSNRIVFHFQDPTKFNDLAFSLLLTVKNAGKEVEFTIPFTVPKNVKPSLTFELTKGVEIEGQKFTIEEVTIHPLRVEVRVSINPNNSKRILRFTDIRLEDENGEIWGSILNGVSGSGGVGDLEQTLFLQSNYFEKPKELYLRVNKLEALDKNEAFILVDTEKSLLLNRPSDGRLQLGETSKKQAKFFLTQDEDDEHNTNLASSIIDATGKVISSPSTTMHYDSAKNESHWSIEFETTNYKNPLQLELFAYPNNIEGDVKVELKNPEK